MTQIFSLDVSCLEKLDMFPSLRHESILLVGTELFCISVFAALGYIFVLLLSLR
jgi:hypothetical protein